MDTMTEREIVESVLALKKEKNAVIVAHTYQIGEVQDLADKTGDSFALSQYVSQVEAERIVFCGVRFMAESAKILSPEKTVLLPAKNAGCPMANMVTAHDVIEMKKAHPNAAAVCYINTNADVKAECDVCVTSSNAVKVVSSLEQEEIIFVPDRNLGGYIGKQLPHKKMILWDGYCIVHERLVEQDVIKWKKLKPNALVLAHPECNEPVLEQADFIGSTKAIIEYVLSSKEKTFIIGTEKGEAHPIRKVRDDVELIFPSACLLCVNMKKTFPIHVYEALRDDKHVIELDADIMRKAKRSLEKMLQLS